MGIDKSKKDILVALPARRMRVRVSGSDEISMLYSSADIVELGGCTRHNTTSLAAFWRAHDE